MVADEALSDEIVDGCLAQGGLIPSRQQNDFKAELE